MADTGTDNKERSVFKENHQQNLFRKIKKGKHDQNQRILIFTFMFLGGSRWYLVGGSQKVISGRENEYCSSSSM